MNARTRMRLGLGLLGANQAAVGLWALAAPASFYATFPTGHGWVALLPPYNEHLVRDVGGLSLGFAVLFGFAIARPDRLLVTAAMAAWLTAAVPHLLFHTTHLQGFTAIDAVAQTTGLTLAVLVPLLVLALAALSARSRTSAGRRERTLR